MLRFAEPRSSHRSWVSHRIGLGEAVVLDGIRRCGERGAIVAYVGTDMPFYLSLGFRKLLTVNCWTRS